MSDEPDALDDRPDSSVLICDDNVAMRVLLGVIIDTAAGLRVAGEAADGNEAVLEATRLQPDVILLDLAMPNRSGLEALPDLRRVAPDAQIVVLSGFASTTVAVEIYALGARTYLQKGADPDTIIATIQSAAADARQVPAGTTG
jgi:DNA-binding NarL/FixJ family response regulator